MLGVPIIVGIFLFFSALKGAWLDFKGCVYWDELTETYGDISRVTGF